MPSKVFRLDDQTVVTIYKRKSSRHLKLSITPRGEIRVSIPYYTPYAIGLQFARAQRAWIAEQVRPSLQLHDGQPIGKAHHLQFVSSPTAAKVSSRVSVNVVTVIVPSHLAIEQHEVQREADRAAIRALRRQAEQLLPQRLARLAAEHGLEYGTVTIRQLKSRWGSCDRQRNITLNLFLMRLDWSLIDYVLLHELNHTRHLHHGPDFWAAMRCMLPDVAERRKQLRVERPALHMPPT